MDVERNKYSISLEDDCDPDMNDCHKESKAESSARIDE
jgi:hypothetical protein